MFLKTDGYDGFPIIKRNQFVKPPTAHRLARRPSNSAACAKLAQVTLR
jgi:hypothetical protein